MKQDKRISWDAERVFSLDFNPQCYNLTPQQIEAIMEIFPHISWDTRWINADSHSRDERLKFAAELMYQLMHPVDCGAIEGENYCIEYPPHSDRIEWYPVSPYNDQENRPTFFSTPVWFVVNLGFWDNFVGDILAFLADKLGIINLLQETTGLANGDVFTCLFSLAQIEDLHLIIDPPGFNVDVPAGSTVELHFVNVPLGGMAYVSLDTDVFEGNIFWDIVQLLDTLLDPNDSVIDLNLDLVSFPPEFTAGATIHEIEVPNDGMSHKIYVRFLPVLDDALTFVRFGGGLRKVVICGEDAIMPQVDCEFVKNCVDFDADNVARDNIVLVQVEQTTQGFLDELENQYTDSPQDINSLIPDVAPNAGERNALCHAIGAWVRLYCEAKKSEIKQASGLSQAWNAIQNAIVNAYGLIDNTVGFIIGHDLFSCFVSNSEALAALSDETAIENLICCLYDELSGITLLQGSLEAALTACSGSDLVCLIQNDLNLQHELNFFYIYGRTLERQNAGEIFECDCEAFDWMYIEYDFTVSAHGFTSSDATWQVGVGWVGNITQPSSGNYRAAATIVKQFPITGKIFAGGMVFSAVSNCGIEEHWWLYFLDGVNQGGRQVGSMPNADDYHITFSNATSYAPEDFNEVRFRINPADCDGVEPHGKGIISKVRIWLDGTSAIKGIPSDDAPTGLPSSGSTSLDYWQ